MKIVSKKTKEVREVIKTEAGNYEYNDLSKGVVMLDLEDYVELISDIGSLQHYAELAFRTCPDLGSYNNNVMHMVAGMRTELIEIEDMYKKSFAYGKPYDYVNHKEELGDFMWYFVNLYRILDMEITSHMNTFDFIWADDFKANVLDKKLVTNLDYDTLIRANNQLLKANSYENILSNKEHFEYKLVQVVAHYFNLYVKSPTDLKAILKNNINKLIIRYPDKFTNQHAVNRNLNSERKQLEE